MDEMLRFKRELTELLAKYDVCISVEVGEGSDTYGICDEAVTFHPVPRREDNRCWTLRVNRWDVDAKDLAKLEFE